MTSRATRSATSSPGSGAGPTPSSSPDGATAPSGPAPVPVSRFRAQDNEKAMPISDTCGPLFTASSPSAILQWSLESRLQARMDTNGSLEYALTWKELDMPAGPPICLLRARARPTSANGYSGWQTPKLPSGGGQEYRATPGGGLRKLEDQVLQVIGNGRYPYDRAMEKRGVARLNPPFSLWLMGFPIMWARCAAQAMPSSPRSPRRSSKRT